MEWISVREKLPPKNKKILWLVLNDSSLQKSGNEFHIEIDTWSGFIEAGEETDSFNGMPIPDGHLRDSDKTRKYDVLVWNGENFRSRENKVGVEAETEFFVTHWALIEAPMQEEIDSIWRT
jgi:hypothetical protein